MNTDFGYKHLTGLAWLLPLIAILLFVLIFIRKKLRLGENFDKAVEDIQRKKLDIAHIDNIKTKPARLSNKVTIDKEDFDLLIVAAQKHIVQEKKESALQKALDTANRLITELKNLIVNLERKLTEASKELAKFDFFKKENRKLNSENDRLRAKIRAYDEVISSHDLSPFFHRECEKEKAREDER